MFIYRDLKLTDVPRVLTNPIYVDADGDGSWTAPGGKLCDYAASVPAPIGR